MIGQRPYGDISSPESAEHRSVGPRCVLSLSYVLGMIIVQHGLKFGAGFNAFLLFLVAAIMSNGFMQVVSPQKAVLIKKPTRTRIVLNGICMSIEWMTRLQSLKAFGVVPVVVLSLVEASLIRYLNGYLSQRHHWNAVRLFSLDNGLFALGVCLWILQTGIYGLVSAIVVCSMGAFRKHLHNDMPSPTDSIHWNQTLSIAVAATSAFPFAIWSFVSLPSLSSILTATLAASLLIIIPLFLQRKAERYDTIPMLLLVSPETLGFISSVVVSLLWSPVELWNVMVFVLISSGAYYRDRNAGKNHEDGKSLQAFSRVLAHLMKDHESRRILLFLSVNIVFMFVEVVVGLMTNSLGLLSDAGHMFFDNSALLIGLGASYISKWGADQLYTYGYGRYETLSGFINALLLVIMSLSILTEGVERFFEPPKVNTDHLLLTSVLGFLVNLVGLICFHDFSHGHHGHGDHDHGHHGHGGCSHHHGHGGNANMYGVYLHVLADTLGSVAVIISSLLIQYKEWYLSDPICSILISLLILGSSVPLIQQTALQLVQRIPNELEGPLQHQLNHIRSNPSVIEIEQINVWRQSSKLVVGSIQVSIHHEASEQVVLNQVKQCLSSIGIGHLTIQITR